MMNIMMVGHRGAGKTAFMAGLYAFCGGRTLGYGVTGKYSVDRVLLQQLSYELSKGHYPEATNTSWESFDLTLLHDGDKVLDFKWTDHRGGILTDYRGDVGTIQQFLKAVEEADALIVFLDGAKLVKPNDFGVVHLVTCIERALRVTHDKKFPICFVLTKWDMVENNDLPGLEQWNNIFDVIRIRSDVEGMMVKSSIPSDGCLAPYHCMVFCLAYGIEIYIERSKERAEAAHKRQLSHESSSIGEFFGNYLEDRMTKIARYLGGSPAPSEWELAGKEREKQAAEVAEQERLKKYGEKFLRMFKTWKEEL